MLFCAAVLRGCSLFTARAKAGFSAERLLRRDSLPESFPAGNSPEGVSAIVSAFSSSPKAGCCRLRIGSGSGFPGGALPLVFVVPELATSGFSGFPGALFFAIGFSGDLSGFPVLPSVVLAGADASVPGCCFAKYQPVPAPRANTSKATAAAMRILNVWSWRLYLSASASAKWVSTWFQTEASGGSSAFSNASRHCSSKVRLPGVFMVYLLIVFY